MRFLSLCSGGRPVIDMIGKRFGRLVVTERVPIPNRGRNDQARWQCTCDCGGAIVAPGHRLRSDGIKSCGCYRRDRAGALYRTHGKSKTTAYMMFYDARKRAQHLGLPFDLDPEKIEVPSICPVLGIPLLSKGPRDNSPSLDRMIPDLGYVSTNVRVISFRANRIKSDATADELARVLSYVRGDPCAF